MDVRSGAAALLLAFAGLAAGVRAYATDAIVLEAAEVRVAGVTLTGVHARLDVGRDARLAARLRAARVFVSPGLPVLGGVDLACVDAQIGRPRLGCPAGRGRIAQGALGPLAFTMRSEYLTDRGRWSVQLHDFLLAHGAASGEIHGAAAHWSGEATLEAASLAQLRPLAPGLGLVLPASLSLAGPASAHATFAGGRVLERLQGTLRLGPLALANGDGTVATEKLAIEANVSVQRLGTAYALELAARGSSGQALAGPALLDLGANPLRLTASARLAGPGLEVSAFEVHMARLLDARGSASVVLGAAPRLRQARLTVEALEFPAAYASFLQIPLASTDFNSLDTSGRIGGEVEFANGAPVRLALKGEGLDVRDTRGERLRLGGLAGEINWVAGRADPVAPSWLAWTSGGAYGLAGGPARLDFRTRGFDFSLLRPARLPVFDGALAVRSFEVRDLGQPTAELNFAADIEPISMPLLSRAFGWPVLSGVLSGTIPALSYRDRTLSFGGDLLARVFDGSVRGSHIRLEDPLGPWPRLHADVEARNLDLQLVTGTFAVGSISGRLDGDIHDLELFRWSPVAFDARLATPAGDPGPHLISAKAVGTLSNIGGGGAGVVASLQSGALRFFKEFHYDRLGIACQLKDEVCLMSGIERSGGGYYIVKGSGLPRVDIIGNAGRVNWPQLVSQVVAGMHSQGITVR